MVLGVVLGAAIATYVFPPASDVQISEATKVDLAAHGITNLSGLMPVELFSWQALTSPVSLLMMVLGGFMVGFGTRYANGCTSGHAIMGLSLLNLGSLVATIGFFIGGLLVTWFLYPILLQP